MDEQDRPLLQPPEGEQAHLGYLARYAREVVRLFLQSQADKYEAGQSASMRGVGGTVTPQAAARNLKKVARGLLDGETRAGVERRRAVLRGWLESPPEGLYTLAELAALFRLTEEDVELFIMAAAPAIDPEITELYKYLWSDVHKRCADVGFLCRLLSLDDYERFSELLDRLRFDEPLRRHRLLLVEDRQSREDRLDRNLVERRVRAADRVLTFLQRPAASAREQEAAVDESLAAVCMRLREPVSFDDLLLPEFSLKSLVQMARARKLPALFEGPSGPGQQHTAQALATAIGKGMLSADLSAMLSLPAERLEQRLAELFREAKLGGDLLYLRGDGLPEHIPGPSMLVLQRMLTDEALVLGVDTLPPWAITLTMGWPMINVPLPEADHRLELWVRAFEGDRRSPKQEEMAVIARRYEMSAAQIHKAAGEARRLAQISRRRRIELADLDKACRAHFAHRLSDLAELIPPMPFKVDDLILPDNEKKKFDEIMLYAAESDAIYHEWGFAEKFPYGRGLSVLFYGPPGTGKTMGATIIASALGLDLFRVDLSRITSRYVGETEKNLARIFDEAERGQVMLLFDEADSLFTKRTSVKSSVDRYANLEVAYLLQRMENFDGVTVLTTNVEHNLDDAFKRRIRYRIFFPMPDAETRTRLWRGLLPRSAPQAPDVPFEVLGEHFELSGGHIKQAVLRAAFYARREGIPIQARHLIEGGVIECRELGMLVSAVLPKKMREALKASEESAAARGEGPKDGKPLELLQTLTDEPKITSIEIKGPR